MNKLIAIISIWIIIFGVVFGLGYLKSRNVAYVTDTVLKTERVVYSSNDSRYLVFGQHETYEDTDSWWFWKFNSSDIYGNIQSGKTYTFKVAGWRIPFLSWYRNIIEVK